MEAESNESIRRRILALRAKTTANGCTPEEADAAAALAERLEGRLGRRVFTQQSQPAPSIRTRIWRGQARAYQAEEERRRAEARRHIFGIKD